MGKSLVSMVALGWFLVTPASSQNRPHDDHSHQVGSQFARLMSAAMDKMHEEMASAPQTGDPDRDFLAMMIPHHAGAVEMARLLLIYGRDPLVRQLAEEIIPTIRNSRDASPASGAAADVEGFGKEVCSNAN